MVLVHWVTELLCMIPSDPDGKDLVNKVKT